MNKKVVAATVALLILVAVLVVSAGHPGLLGHARTGLIWIEQSGRIGMIGYVLVYVVACILLVPRLVLTVCAGAIYGVVTGTIIASLASTLGATAAFLIGRHLARDWVARRLAGHSLYRAIDELVAVHGWRAVILTRFSPAFPFLLVNYAYGLTRVSLRDYVLASWIGTLPGTTMSVYLGSLAGSIAAVGTSAAPERTRADWILFLLGLLATIAVATSVARIARRTLARRMPVGAPPDE